MGQKFPQTPFKVNANTFVFGAFDGGWFKMQSVDAEGNLLESRHSCQGGGASGAEAISSIDDLTQDIWQAANRGGGYSAEDVVVGACEEYSGLVCSNVSLR